MKNNLPKVWIAVGVVIVGIIAASGIAIGILAINGVFDNSSGEDDSCPVGQHKSCGVLAGDEEICTCTSGDVEVKKPIIYLYPETEMEVTIRLGSPEKLTTSYPKYADGWNVIAYPNGDLIDKASGNKLYSLYWEGQEKIDNFDMTTGFIVKGTDSAKFLEEKLAILGLNYKEKEEFIVYWLPKLEANRYNYIYFATAEEINKEMPIEVSIQPDTMIRVKMLYKGLEEAKEINAQELEIAPERSGFTMVEWGGVEL